MKIIFVLLIAAVAFVTALPVEIDQSENNQNTIDALNTENNQNGIVKRVTDKTSDILVKTAVNVKQFAVNSLVGGAFYSEDLIIEFGKFVQQIEGNPNYKIDTEELNALEKIFAKAIATVYKISDKLHIPHRIIKGSIVSVAFIPLSVKGFGATMTGILLADTANGIVNTFNFTDEEIKPLIQLPLHYQLKGIGVLVGKKLKEEVKSKILGVVKTVTFKIKKNVPLMKAPTNDD